MRWFWQQQEHPYTRDHFRFLLATTPLWLLLLWYVGINLLIAAALGSAYFLLQSSGEMAVWDWFFYSLLQLFAAEPPPEMSFSLNDWQRIVFVVNAVFGLLLPTILLGSIVFRIFVQRDVIMFRNKLALYYSEKRGKYLLCARIYSTSHLDIVYPSMTFIFRQGFAAGTTHKFIQEKHHALMTHHHPHIFNLKLEKDDIDLSGENPRLNSLNGHKITKDSKLTIIVRGEIPALKTNFMQIRTYNLPTDVQWGRWKLIAKEEIYIATAWKNFEEISEPFTPMPGHAAEASKPPSRERPSVG